MLRRLFRFLAARPRLVTSVAVGVAAGFLLPDLLAGATGGVATRALVGWNVFAALYLAMAWRMMVRAEPRHILAHAVDQDDGRVLMLVLVVAASIAVLSAIGSQLAAVRSLHGAARDGRIALAAVTVLTAWAFTQTSFALHYAHDFALTRERGLPDGLLFPGTPDPRYLDFLYFACVIGTSGQTADVSFTSSPMRATGMAHCVQAFFFNTMVLALTINIAAGLF